MKILFSVITLFLTHFVYSSDIVDQLYKKYQQIENDGLAKLHTRHITELEKIKKSAMVTLNLDLANKADLQINKLKAEIAVLSPKNPTNKAGEDVKILYPKTVDYVMYDSNNKRWTENNGEITCKFKSTKLLERSSDKLYLIIVVDQHSNSNTKGSITIKDHKTGRIVAKFKGLKKGASQKIPLDLVASDSVELSIACGGGDGLRIMDFTKNSKPAEGKDIPHVLLSIQ